MERRTAHLLSEIDSTMESSDEQEVRHDQTDLPEGDSPTGSLHSDASQNSPHESSPILTVRSARAGDAFGLRRVRSVVRLNQPEAMLDRFHPFRESIASSLPLPRTRSRLLVAHHGTRIRGFVHVEPVWPDQRWVITEIGGSGSEPIE